MGLSITNESQAEDLSRRITERVLIRSIGYEIFVHKSAHVMCRRLKILSKG